MKKSLFAFTLSLLVGGVAAAGAAADKTTLTVLFSSDMHGAMLPYDYFTGETAPGDLARLVSLVRQVRRENPNTLLLDGGDTIQGNPLLYYAAKHGLREPNPAIAAMNIAGYDAMAVGNHEFNFGMDVLRRAESEADFPFLSANTLVERSQGPAFEPYKVIERGGVRIGILGLVTPAVPYWELPKHIEGLRFEDPVAAARRWVPFLRGEKKCDLVIVVLHSGFETVGEEAYSEGTAGENRAYALATEVEGVDLLLTGHSHRLVEPRPVGKTFGATCPAHARRIIRVDVEVTKDQGGAVQIGMSGHSVELTGELEVDHGAAEAVASLHARTEEYLDQVVTRAPERLEVAPERLRDTRLMDVLQAAQLEASGADVSIASLLPWGGYELPAGPVTRRQIFRFYPYENHLVAIRVKGRALKAFLEWSACYYDGLVVNDGARLAVKINPEVAPYNVDFAEGVHYRIDPGRPVGNRVRDLAFRGRPLGPEQELTVALNSYRFSGGGGYGMFAGSPVIYKSAIGVREILIEYLEKNGLASAACSYNWYVAPDLVGVLKK